MGKRALLVAAIVALIVAIILRTPLVSVDENVSDFAGGAAVGLWIGVVVNWLADRR